MEIATLAASLKCDIDLIFEYVYNNIEYEPLFGSNKGALGTLLDQRGSDLDQAQLFTALLSESGYSQSQFLADAGGSQDSVSIWNLSRANIRSDLTKYANSLINYIKATNPAWTLSDVVGGKTIQYLTGSPKRETTLPNLSQLQPSGFPQNWGALVPNAYRTCFTISMPGVTPTQCGATSAQTIQLYADQTYGHRVTVFSTPSGSNYIPTLLIDGALPPNGQNTGPAAAPGTTWNLSICILHPYTSPDFNVCHTSPVTDAKALTVKAGGSYLIGAGWGQVGRGMIEKHRTLLSEARATGNSPSSELVLGEALAMTHYTWLAEAAAEQRLGDAIAKTTTQYHHGVGISAQAQIHNKNLVGPYVDLPLNSLTVQPQTSYIGSGFPRNAVGHFYTDIGAMSSLESAVLEQTQALTTGIQAASTVRLVDMNVATGAKTFFADGTTSAGVAAYFQPGTGIRASLVGYSPADLSAIDCAVSTTCMASGSPTGSQLLLPANGNITVSQWQGAGYTISRQTGTTIEVTQRISGGLSGGFSGDPISSSAYVESVETEFPPTPAIPAIPPAVFANDPAPNTPTISDPVDAVTGAYIYQHDDLRTGGGVFPYALSFGRTYVSAANLVDAELGYGWTHNFNIQATRTSNPLAGFGESSPISAAAAIAAIYVSQDLLASSKNAQNLTIGWVIARWLTDRLTNNSVIISWPGTSEEFTLLPHDEGSQTALYNSPRGSAVILTGSVPDQYGNYTTFAYRNKDQSLLTFNSVASGSEGQIANWSFPNGMSLGFQYAYSFNGTSYLSSVANSIGRTLTFNYSGSHLSSVVDDTGRAVSFAYDTKNNLSSVTDPLQLTTNFLYDGANRLTQANYPATGGPFFTNVYDALGRINRQGNANGNFSTFYVGGTRTEFVDAIGNRHVTYQSPRGKILKDVAVLNNSAIGNIYNDTSQQDGIVNVTTKEYDGLDRLTRTVASEGGSVVYSYDSNTNVLATTLNSKFGPSPSPQVTSYTYDPVFNKATSITDPLGLVTAMNYAPPTGNLVSSTSDVGGSPHFNATQVYSYSPIGLLVSATDPLGTVTTFGYDNLGNQTSAVRDVGLGHLNQITSFRYNTKGDLIYVADARGNTTTNAFDANRRLALTTNPSGLTTVFSYDQNGQIIQTQKSANQVTLRTTKSTYTPTGKVAASTDANGNTTNLSYDLVDRLASVTDPMGRVTSYGYDALSRQISVSNPAIQSAPLLQETYTPDGLLASLTDANSHTTSFAYDGLDRLATTTYPLGNPETFTYDADNNMLTRKTRAGQTISFTYDTLNRVKTKTSPAPAPLVTYGYDLAGRLTRASDTSAAITAAASPSGPFVASYSYDAMNRPISVSWTPAPAQATPTASSVTFGHSYNKANQRVGQTVTDNSWLNYPPAASTTSYAADSLNRYTIVGAMSPTYDSNSNLTSDGTFSLGYDSENRLVSANGAGNTATYTFDAQGRRKTKTVNGTTTVFVTDADNREVLEYNGSTGAIQRWYAYGLGPNTVLNQMNVPAATRTTLVPDMLGSIVGSLDSSATSLAKVGYLPYGKSGSAGPFGFTGQRVDTETGGLYYYRARQYSPAWGRFLQADPIGYNGGAHLYAYVKNDPLNLFDPYGYCPCVAVPVYYGLMAAVGAGTTYYGAKALNDTTRMVPNVLNSNSAEPKPVYVDPEKYPESAGHVQDAQNAGAPDVVTVDRGGAAGRRKEALAGTTPQSGTDRDEYPPAAATEGGSGASVRPIDSSDNRGWGGSFGGQIRDVPDGGQVKIIVGPKPSNFEGLK